ncbi:MAG: 16S rRNA (cytidine(1402)-2'-O)-methyltransferase [Candidatus Pacebacteria bacterium]|nr:16S rRNA (cytidine(1402)-2'-O)-methyltransferase [Candidatus Paceibacterota bacterium]
MATLWVVATPIGNLQDMTFRSVQTLKDADAILCEDTRVTAKLLQHFEITKPLIAYHQHSSDAVVARAALMLNEGRNLALVSDAGTPGVNDPGGRLVEQLLSAVDDLVVVPIVGANAAIAALSVCGFPADRFSYWGFVPHKKGRETFFREIAEFPDTVVFYEGKYRMAKALAQLAACFAVAETPERRVVVGREITKKFETFYRGTALEVARALEADSTLGEFVVVVAPKAWK